MGNTISRTLKQFIDTHLSVEHDVNQKIAFKFYISKRQYDKFLEWACSLPNTYQGAIGGRFVFEFSDTDLGQTQHVRDQCTGEKLDLTDYSDW